VLLGFFLFVLCVQGFWVFWTVGCPPVLFVWFGFGGGFFGFFLVFGCFCVCLFCFVFFFEITVSEFKQFSTSNGHFSTSSYFDRKNHQFVVLFIKSGKRIN